MTHWRTGMHAARSDRTVNVQPRALQSVAARAGALALASASAAHSAEPDGPSLWRGLVALSLLPDVQITESKTNKLLNADLVLQTSKDPSFRSYYQPLHGYAITLAQAKSGPSFTIKWITYSALDVYPDPSPSSDCVSATIALRDLMTNGWKFQRKTVFAGFIGRRPIDNPYYIYRRRDRVLRVTVNERVNCLAEFAFYPHYVGGN
jgi:hypothetical protein